MTSDATRPSGDEAPERRPLADGRPTGLADPLPHGVRAASKFVGRISQLDADAVRTVVHIWHDVMRRESEAWFAAEQATGRAVVAAGRSVEQEILLGHLGDCFLRGVWYRGAQGDPPTTPEGRVGATEASGQYVASVAMLALLVREQLTPSDFALLYWPFAALIPLEELGRE